MPQARSKPCGGSKVLTNGHTILVMALQTKKILPDANLREHFHMFASCAFNLPYLSRFLTVWTSWWLYRDEDWHMSMLYTVGPAQGISYVIRHV